MSAILPDAQWLGQKAQELENSVQQHGRQQGADMIGGLIPYLFSGEFAPITMALSGAGNQADAAERQGKYGTTRTLALSRMLVFRASSVASSVAMLLPSWRLSSGALADGIAQRLGGTDIVGRAVAAWRGSGTGITQGLSRAGAARLPCHAAGAGQHHRS
jgi:hypothetical protein